MENILFRCRVLFTQQGGVAGPAYFHAAKQIRFRARHLVKPGGLETRSVAKDFRVRVEGHSRAAPVFDGPFFLQAPLWFAPGKPLLIQLLIAGHFHNERV